MSRVCRFCPIADLHREGKINDESIESGLFLQAIQGLSGKMVAAVEGTVAGLTDGRIEEIRQSEIRTWHQAGGDEEASYLEANPELAKAVHDCELKTQLGQCVVYSARAVSG